MRNLLRPLRLAFRLHRRRPLPTLVIVLSLVLGIGVNVAVVSLLDAVFLRPLPLDDMDRLVVAYRTQRSESGEYVGKGRFAFHAHLDLQQRTRTLRPLGAFTWGRVNVSASGAEPRRAVAMFADRQYFELLGLEPALGRFFQDDEGAGRSVAPVAVLSHAAWREQFGADPEVVGRTLRVNGHPFSVVGVAPEGFRGTELHVAPDLWVPLLNYVDVGLGGEWFDSRDFTTLTLLGRLAPGVEPAEAEEELQALSQQLEAEYPEAMEGHGVELDPLLEGVLLPRERPQYLGHARVLALSSLLLLLVSCLNAVVLLSVRGLERRSELAVRQAVGAGRWRLVRQLTLENLLLFAVGSVLALPAALLTLELLARLRPPAFEGGGLDPSLDGHRLLLAAGLAAAATLLFGVLPALATARHDLSGEIRGSRERAASRWRAFRSGDLLVVGQVALATVALVGAVLFADHLWRVQGLDLGFEAERLAVVTLAPGDQGYPDEQVRDLWTRLEETVRALPGVEAAALSQNRLLRGSIIQYALVLEGETDPIEGGGRLHHRTNAVSPGFFATVGIPLVRGRDFDARDREGAPPVVIVNRTMADLAWPGEAAVGKRFHLGGPEEVLVEVVGVAEDAKYRYVHEDPQFFLYVPLDQHLPGSATLHVRTAGDPADVLPDLRRVLRELDPALPLEDLAPLRRFVAEALWLERSAALFLGGMALLALVLVVIGIHGVVAFMVRQRDREHGIRLSLGAGRRSIVAGVLARTGLRVGAGLVLGLALVFLVLRPFATVFLAGFDPGTTVVATVVAVLLVALAGLLGALGPAFTAIRWRPARLLREG